VLVAAMLAVDAIVYLLVVRPVRRMAAVADELSVGNTSAGDFPLASAPELTGLMRSFNRMRISLEKAMKLAEPT
jgi:HAMP domain-containing protein